MRKAQIIVGFFAILFAGCGRSDPSSATEGAGNKVSPNTTSNVPTAISSRKELLPVSSNAPPQPHAMLTKGGTAYVRIEEFESAPITNASPEGNTQTLKFADVVKLENKRDVPWYPTFWLVSDGKGGPQSWVPGYVLTPNLAEINMLRGKDRIPVSMTFIYDSVVEGGETKTLQHGRVRLPGTPMIATVTAGGVSVTDQGSSQVAFKRGNAVVFDESTSKTKWAFPMVFSDGSNTFPMAAGKMFYCTEAATYNDAAGKFDCLELAIP